MNISIALSLVVLVVGLLLFCFARGKAPEIGRIMFAAALIVLLWTAGSVSLRLGW